MNIWKKKNPKTQNQHHKVVQYFPLNKIYLILFGEERETPLCGELHFFWGYKIEAGEGIQKTKVSTYIMIHIYLLLWKH